MINICLIYQCAVRLTNGCLVWDLCKGVRQYNRHRSQEFLPRSVLLKLLELFQGDDRKFFQAFDKDLYNLVFVETNAFEINADDAMVLLVALMRHFFYRDAEGKMHVVKYNIMADGDSIPVVKEDPVIGNGGAADFKKFHELLPCVIPKGILNAKRGDTKVANFLIDSAYCFDRPAADEDATTDDADALTTAAAEMRKRLNQGNVAEFDADCPIGQLRKADGTFDWKEVFQHVDERSKLNEGEFKCLLLPFYSSLLHLRFVGCVE